MGRSLLLVALGLVGLLCAAGIGVAAYVVSRDSVAVPVTRLQPGPQTLTPARVRTKPQPRPTTTVATTTTVQPGTTVDDHGGRTGGGGNGNSGHGGGGSDD